MKAILPTNAVQECTSVNVGAESIDLRLWKYIDPNNSRKPFLTSFADYTVENFTPARALSTLLCPGGMNEWGGMAAYRLAQIRYIQLFLDSVELPLGWGDIPNLNHLIEFFELLCKPGIESEIADFIDMFAIPEPNPAKKRKQKKTICHKRKNP